MQTTSGLLTYLSHRLGAAGLMVMIVLALAVALVAGLTVFALSEPFAATSDPMQFAPVRWVARR